jgi:uncharacterized protein YndB with AHSA1/START domain
LSDGEDRQASDPSQRCDRNCDQKTVTEWKSVSSLESDAPPSAVWSAFVDGRRWSFWHPGFEWMWLEGELERGSVATLKLRRYRQTAFVIDEVVPGRRLVMRTSFGPVARVRLILEVEPFEHGSRVAYSVVADGIFGGMAARMIGRRLAEGAPEALEQLATYAVTAGKEEAR